MSDYIDSGIIGPTTAGDTATEAMLKCAICDILFPPSSHRLRDHCLSCSKRARAVMMKAPDETVRAWVKGLRKEQPNEYKKMILKFDAESESCKSASVSDHGLDSRFNLRLRDIDQEPEPEQS